MNGFISFDEGSIQIEDDPPDLFLQIAENVLESQVEMAGNILADAKRVEGIFGKDKIGFPGGAAVGDTIANEEDGVIIFPVRLDEPLFAGSATSARLIKMGENDVHPIRF